MEIETFIKKLKGTFPLYEIQSYIKYLKVYRYSDHFKIAKDDKIKCSKCHQFLNSSNIEIDIYFYSMPEHLTVFEVNMLYALFVLNKKPYDYASFHKSPHGEKFILNIKEIK